MTRNDSETFSGLGPTRDGAGTRPGWWRTIGIGVAAAAGVAVVAVGGSRLTGPDQTTLDDQVPVAAQSRSAPVHTHPVRQATKPHPPRHRSPVWLDAPAWRCDEPADEKFVCSDGNRAGVVVTWRPAAQHAAYLDPGKADVTEGVHTFVSRVHGRFFATVAPAPGATQAQVDEVGAALVWRS